MSKTITISDETFEALQEQIKKLEQKRLEEKKPYPIAALSVQGGARLILNLPDVYLSSDYKGCVFSIMDNGNPGKKEPKGKLCLGHFYTFCGHEEQVFPVPFLPSKE